MKRFILLIAILLPYVANASQPRKVLIIGIDGTRSDALQQASTPNIDAIISNSFFTYESWHRGITISGPTWSSIMCGVEYPKHGVTDNTYSNSQFNIYPYFTTRAKSCLPDLYCVQIVQWTAMSNYVYNDSWNKKIIVDDGQGSQSVSQAQAQLANPNLDVLFVYFDEVDIAGHTSGFSPYNPDYMNAIETVDGHIGSILTALHNRSNYANEEWIVLLTTDHGGILKGHGGLTPWERNIWWIGAGNRKGTHQLKNVKDPGNIQLGIYSPVIAAQSPGPCDIAVTALDHLLKNDCGINPEWNLDGKSWLDSIYVETVTALTDLKAPDLNLVSYPNPSNGLVIFEYANPNREKVTYGITDIHGRKLVIQNEAFKLGPTEFTLDLHDKPKGIYLVTIVIGQSKQTHRITIE
jgi:hypothetical protein